MIDSLKCQVRLTSDRVPHPGWARLGRQIGESPLQTKAIILSAPRDLAIAPVALSAPREGDVVVAVRHSAISTGTEKLFWSGEMPPFPGMGYPLVPGYEAAGEIVEAGTGTGFAVGDHVFVPGANCFDGVRGLFGAASAMLVTPAHRVTRIDSGFGAAGALLALAATALHAMTGPGKTPPDLIVGHGMLGRLLARLTLAAGHAAPTVWEVAPQRMAGATGYAVTTPEADPRRDYASIYDASGQSGLLDDLIGRIARGGEIVLAGFYTAPLQFTFPPAFMKEARLRISAEWQPEDMAATRDLVECGALRLDDLITHVRAADDAAAAYEAAFTDPACLKMILNWSET